MLVSTEPKPHLASALNALANSGSPITVRDLIGLWGSKGRGSQVPVIRRDLERMGLTTHPPLEYGALDNLVVLLRAGEVFRTAPPTDDGPDAPEERPDPRKPPTDEPGILHVGQIPSALGGLSSVNGSMTVRRAQTLMIRYDFSQLAVVDDQKSLVGVVSWESIALSSLQGTVALVSQCMRKPITVAQDADVLASIGVIVDAGYVIVVDPQGAPTGIVTTADLATQFDRLARPFLTVAECERELRNLLDRHFTPTELDKATMFKKPEKPGASAMTVGDIKKFVANRENWARMKIRLSHGAFIDWLDVLRVTRNEIAHLNQDDEAISPALNEVKNLTAFIRSGGS
jgi:restriction system protein